MEVLRPESKTTYLSVNGEEYETKELAIEASALHTLEKLVKYMQTKSSAGKLNLNELATYIALEQNNITDAAHYLHEKPSLRPLIDFKN